MRTKALKRVVWGSCLCVALAAEADDWQPTLTAAPHNNRGPSDPIELLLPPLPIAVLQSLTLELDEIDVTQLVNSDGRHASFVPPQPLAYGEHALRLVENAPDGNIIERGVWTIEVRKSAAFREASLQANVSLNGISRVADDNLAEPKPNPNTANGAAQIRGVVAGDAWRTTGYLEVIGSSEKKQMPRQDQTVDLARFLLQAEAGPVIAQAGDHMVGPESLVLQNFDRRGVSVSVQSPENVVSVSGFSMRTQQIMGFQQGLGLGDAGNRTDGAVIAGHPLPSNRDALTLWATYVKGEGPSQAGDTGTGTVGDTTPTRGDAQSLVAESQLLQQRLRLRGEVAQSRFDFDGRGRDTDGDGAIDSNLAAEVSRAESALLSYMPWRDLDVAGRPLALTVGLDQRRIGSYFHSVANPSSIADRELVRGFTNLNWAGLDLQLVRATESDNVDAIDWLPRTRTDQTFVGASYTPPPPVDGAAGARPWYGQPSFNVSWLELGQEVVRSSALVTNGKLRANHVTSVGAAFTYAQWSWGVNHTLATTDELAGLAADTVSRATQLNGRFQLREGLAVTPNYQVSRVEQRDAPFGYRDTVAETTTLGLTLDYLINPRLGSMVNYSRNRETNTGVAEIARDDLSAAVNWLAVPATGNGPGWVLAIEGSRHDDNDPYLAGAQRDKYQLFVKAALTWAPTF